MRDLTQPPSEGHGLPGGREATRNTYLQGYPLGQLREE